jgi:hypothetical protein
VWAGGGGGGGGRVGAAHMILKVVSRMPACLDVSSDGAASQTGSTTKLTYYTQE